MKVGDKVRAKRTTVAEAKRHGVNLENVVGVVKALDDIGVVVKFPNTALCFVLEAELEVIENES